MFHVKHARQPQGHGLAPKTTAPCPTTASIRRFFWHRPLSGTPTTAKPADNSPPSTGAWKNTRKQPTPSLLFHQPPASKHYPVPCSPSASCNPTPFHTTHPRDLRQAPQHAGRFENTVLPTAPARRFLTHHRLRTRKALIRWFGPSRPQHTTIDSAHRGFGTIGPFHHQHCGRATGAGNLASGVATPTHAQGHHREASPRCGGHFSSNARPVGPSHNAPVPQCALITMRPYHNAPVSQCARITMDPSYVPPGAGLRPCRRPAFPRRGFRPIRRSPHARPFKDVHSDVSRETPPIASTPRSPQTPTVLCGPNHQPTTTL